MEKREIDELEPYLEKRNGFSWLPQSDTEYYASEAAHANVKFSQHERDVMNIPDYLLWSIGNFFLFFVLGIVCIILSVRVREHKRHDGLRYHLEDFQTYINLEYLFNGDRHRFPSYHVGFADQQIFHYILIGTTYPCSFPRVMYIPFDCFVSVPLVVVATVQITHIYSYLYTTALGSKTLCPSILTEDSI